ncbi:MAG: hypothetical protein ACUVUC_04595 [Thermoguttaceae bacterium]
MGDLAHPVRALHLQELLGAKRFPLLWALPQTAREGRVRSLLVALGRWAAGRHRRLAQAEPLLSQWLIQTEAGPWDAPWALEALAWCHALAHVAGVVSKELRLTLVQRLVAAVEQPHRAGFRDPLACQLLAGELPLTMACVLPGLVTRRSLLRGARRALSAGLVRLVDGQGLLPGRYAQSWLGLVACWTRCRALGSHFRGGCWSVAAQARYRRLVCRASEWMRPDGTPVFSRGPAVASTEMISIALRLAGGRTNRQGADHPAGQRPRPPEPGLPAPLEPPAVHSRRAGVALLRPGSSRSDPRVTVAYWDASVQIELGVGRDVLWSGPWELEIRSAGGPLEARSPWEPVCWISDAQVDYLELEIRWTGGFRTQRHILLARQDRLLLLADAVLGSQRGLLAYCGRLPLRKSVVFQPAAESHEGFLVASRRRALLLPLALPEWRSDPEGGTLAQTQQGLRLSQSAEGRCLFAPLWIDLDCRRFAGPLTWRRLTVAENLTVQPPDVAVGYRVLVDRQQWVIYRALASKGNRTLLGHNLCSEMLVGRFLRSGCVEPILEIE